MLNPEKDENFPKTLLVVDEHVVIYRPRKKKKIRLYWFSTFQSTLSKDKFKNADDEQVYYLNQNMFELYKSTAVVTDNKVRKSTKLNSVLFSGFVTFLIIGFMIFNGISSFSMLRGEEEVQTEEKQDTDDSQTSEPLLEPQPVQLQDPTTIRTHQLTARQHHKNVLHFIKNNNKFRIIYIMLNKI